MYLQLYAYIKTAACAMIINPHFSELAKTPGPHLFEKKDGRMKIEHAYSKTTLDSLATKIGDALDRADQLYGTHNEDAKPMPKRNGTAKHSSKNHTSKASEDGKIITNDYEHSTIETQVRNNVCRYNRMQYRKKRDKRHKKDDQGALSTASPTECECGGVMPDCSGIANYLLNGKNRD